VSEGGIFFHNPEGGGSFSLLQRSVISPIVRVKTGFSLPTRRCVPELDFRPFLVRDKNTYR
jgi:hypothetical protein